MYFALSLQSVFHKVHEVQELFSSCDQNTTKKVICLLLLEKKVNQRKQSFICQGNKKKYVKNTIVIYLIIGP